MAALCEQGLGSIRKRPEHLWSWEVSAQNPGLQLLDAKLLLPGQHFVVKGSTGVASPVVQVSVQPQPKLATREKRKRAVKTAQSVQCLLHKHEDLPPAPT